MKTVGYAKLLRWLCKSQIKIKSLVKYPLLKCWRQSGIIVIQNFPFKFRKKSTGFYYLWNYGIIYSHKEKHLYILKSCSCNITYYDTVWSRWNNAYRSLVKAGFQKVAILFYRYLLISHKKHHLVKEIYNYSVYLWIFLTKDLISWVLVFLCYLIKNIPHFKCHYKLIQGFCVIFYCYWFFKLCYYIAKNL